MATPSIETVRGWRGRVMVDRDGNKIGEVVVAHPLGQRDHRRHAHLLGRGPVQGARCLHLL
jgi:hypothetical protein